MKRYKVQWAYANQIGSPSIHSNEAGARGEVAYLLGTWIRRRLVDYVARLEQNPKGHDQFVESLRYVLNEIDRLIAQGQVWEAYDLWEEFYVRFENEFGYPLFIGIGTVIVEGSRATGLKNRMPLLEPTDEAPIDQIKKPFVVINPGEAEKMKMLHELEEVVARKASLKDITITSEAFMEAIILAENAANKQFPNVDAESERRRLEALREGVLRRLFPKPPTVAGIGKRWSLR